MPVLTIDISGLGSGRENRVPLELRGNMRYTTWNAAASVQRTQITVASGVDVRVFLPEYVMHPGATFQFVQWENASKANVRTISNLTADQSISAQYARVGGVAIGGLSVGVLAVLAAIVGLVFLWKR